MINPSRDNLTDSLSGDIFIHIIWQQKKHDILIPCNTKATPTWHHSYNLVIWTFVDWQLDGDWAEARRGGEKVRNVLSIKH